MIYEQSWPVEELFDCLPDVVFFIKDAAGNYVVVNDTLVKRCGADSKSALVGKTPSQVLGPDLGVSYEKQDRTVLKTGEPILNQLELHVYPNRSIGWCLTNKRALRDANGVMTGLTGISQDLRTPDMSHEPSKQLQPVIDYAADHLSDPPDINTLSAIANLSPYQLDRRVRRVFGLSTGQWILKQRLDLARKQLLQTDFPIAEVAFNAGYRDQSAFTRQFVRATGFTPSAFRQARGKNIQAPPKGLV